MAFKINFYIVQFEGLENKMTEKKLGSKIEGEEYLVLHEFVKKAREKLPKETWDYLIGASETETTFKRNRFALDNIAFRPRVLRDVENVDLSVNLFGHNLKMPVILAPIGSMQDFVDGAGTCLLYTSPSPRDS